jgi:hypothetical protein
MFVALVALTKLLNLTDPFVKLLDLKTKTHCSALAFTGTLGSGVHWLCTVTIVPPEKLIFEPERPSALKMKGTSPRNATGNSGNSENISNQP